MINAAIYDPQLLSSEGIKTILMGSPLVQDVAVFDAEKPLTEQLNSDHHNLVILDYSLFQSPAIKEVEAMIPNFPKVSFLVISDNEDPLRIRRFINLGIRGFLTKNCSAEEIQTALRLIQDGGKFYCQHVIELIADQDQAANLELSERELEIIDHVTQGHSSAKIADRLHVSIHTINSHRKNILKKLGLKSPTELIIYAVKQGWVNL